MSWKIGYSVYPTAVNLYNVSKFKQSEPLGKILRVRRL